MTNSFKHLYSLICIALLVVTSCEDVQIDKQDAIPSPNDVANPSALASARLVPPSCNNRAILLDGVDDYIDLGDIMNTTTFPISVAAWVNVDSTKSTTSPIFVTQDHSTIYKGFWFAATGTHLFAEYGDGRGGNNPAYRKGRSANVGVMNNGWKYVAAVLNGVNDVKLYIDGVDIGGAITGSSTYTMSTNDPATAKIGKKFINGVTYYFKGLIDDVSVWSKSLSVTEINQYMNQNPTGSETNLIAYWNFDENGGTTVQDASPNNYDGVINGGAQRVASSAPNHCINGAITLDGTNDYIELNDILNTTTFPISVSAWVKIDSTKTDTSPIFVTQDHLTDYKGFWFAATSTHLFAEYGDGLGGNNPLYRRGRSANVGNINTGWKYVTAVLSGVDNVTLYIDGVNIGGAVTGDSQNTMSTNDPATAKIGKKSINSVNYFFKGTIDDVSVWSKSLTVTEINQYKNQLLTGNESSLIGYWNFDEPSGNTVFDLSPSNFDGTLVNGPVRVTSTAPNH
ncbi:LamG domain-containing protein [Ohtaekwangia kribbensis]|jgi:hypothetical protein|uniref:LamG domain-containing protein n=1 Tax=Ohtaekwangia kribbensis TaxID=688913 RepID=A0ABW3JV93_9BACT